VCVCWQQLKNACLVSFFGGNGVERLVFKRKSGALIRKVKFRPLLNYHELDWGRLQTSGIAKRMDWTGRGFGLSKVGLGQHEPSSSRQAPAHVQWRHGWTILCLSGRNDVSYLVT
jgi:hypothetical protein